GQDLMISIGQNWCLCSDVWKEGLVNGYDTEKHPSKFIIVNSKACLMKQTRSLLIKLSLDD
ncbi:1109_t:CDS:1, partial [Entrophospora sp. SA101]